MPEKEGDDDKKSTKSVVNKRQKQMMGEEGYDIARDMGKVKPSKDKKDATTMPPSKEMKKTQKVNKGPSAFERVKAKYGKSVMNVGKKKANEELDLSKVAEAFGGHIVEQEKIESANRQAGDPKKREERAKRQKAFAKKMRELDAIEGERPEPVQKQMAKSSIEDDPRERGVSSRPKATSGAYLNPDGTLRVNPMPSAVNPDSPNQPDDGTVAQTIGGLKTFRVPPETLQPGVNPTGERRRGRPIGAKDRTQRYVAKNPSKKDEVLAAMTPGQRERNLRRIKKDIDDRNPTIQTQVGPVPYRNRRVPKTRSLVPQYDRTPEIMKPDTDELLKFKDFRKRTKTTTAELDKNQEFKAPPIPQTQTEVPPPPPPINRRRKTGEFDGSRAFNSIKKFAKKNPQIAAAGGLAAYDLGKGVLGKIFKTLGRASTVRGGRAIQVSAGK